MLLLVFVALNLSGRETINLFTVDLRVFIRLMDMNSCPVLFGNIVALLYLGLILLGTSYASSSILHTSSIKFGFASMIKTDDQAFVPFKRQYDDFYWRLRVRSNNFLFAWN